MESKISQRVEAVVYLALSGYLLAGFANLSVEKRLLVGVPGLLLAIGAIGLWRSRRWGTLLIAAALLCVAAYYGVQWLGGPRVGRQLGLAVASALLAIHNLRVGRQRATEADLDTDENVQPDSDVPPEVHEALGYFNRANVLRETDKEEAVRLYTQCHELWPQLDEALYNRALTYSELGRDREAKADELELARRGAKEAATLQALLVVVGDANISMGNHALDSGDFAAAAQHYDRALVYRPDDPGALVGLGLVARQRNELMQAGEFFDRALRHSPTDEIALFNRAHLRLDLKQYSAALSDLDALLAVNPADAEAVALHRRVQSELDKAL